MHSFFNPYFTQSFLDNHNIGDKIIISVPKKQNKNLILLTKFEMDLESHPISYFAYCKDESNNIFKITSVFDSIISPDIEQIDPVLLKELKTKFNLNENSLIIDKDSITIKNYNKDLILEFEDKNISLTFEEIINKLKELNEKGLI